jgi:hypothetical protein
MLSAVIPCLTIKFLLSAALLDEFSEGFWYGVIVTLIIGGFIFLLSKFWKSVRRFFTPTRVPATNPGPSPVKNMGGCLVSALFMLGVAVIAAFFIQYVF